MAIENAMPSTVNVCGVPYAVKMVGDNFKMDAHFGEIDYVKGEIRINKEMPEVLQTQTLIHEWLHGTLALLGYMEENNEHFINALSIAISQTFTLK